VQERHPIVLPIQASTHLIVEAFVTQCKAQAPRTPPDNNALLPVRHGLQRRL
jgi:hypothetical protein